MTASASQYKVSTTLFKKSCSLQFYRTAVRARSQFIRPVDSSVLQMIFILVQSKPLVCTPGVTEKTAMLFKALRS
jgi:hypothetical protein